MQNNFPKIPLFFAILFFCISLFTFYYFFGVINSKNQQSQLTENKWNTEMQRREEIRALDNSIKIIAEDRTQLETHFAQSSDVVPFLDTIEGLAPKSGIKTEVTSMDILGDNAGLLVGLKASGTFGSFYKFLTLLENSPYELEFTGMEMRKETTPSTSSKKVAPSVWGVVFKIKLLSFIK